MDFLKKSVLVFSIVTGLFLGQVCPMDTKDVEEVGEEQVENWGISPLVAQVNEGNPHDLYFITASESKTVSADVIKKASKMFFGKELPTKSRIFVIPDNSPLLNSKVKFSLFLDVIAYIDGLSVHLANEKETINAREGGILSKLVNRMKSAKNSLKYLFDVDYIEEISVDHTEKK